MADFRWLVPLTRPMAQNVLNFMQFFYKIWQNCMLASSPTVSAPSPEILDPFLLGTTPPPFDQDIKSSSKAPQFVYCYRFTNESKNSSLLFMYLFPLHFYKLQKTTNLVLLLEAQLPTEHLNFEIYPTIGNCSLNPLAPYHQDALLSAISSTITLNAKCYERLSPAHHTTLCLCV